MHNAFQNKRRRLINFREMQVEGVLPEHFAQYYPQFISLLERYYEFQDTNNSTELISHLFASRDINETDLTLLTFIEDELLLGEAYFQGFGSSDVELRAAANFSNILFRSKGSKFAIEWFFRSFYGEDVEVIYPKENIFKIGDAESQLGAGSLRYLTDDKLYQTFALLIRVGIPISKWKEVFKLFSHPAGMYLGGEVFLVNDVEVGVKTLNDTILQYTTPTYDMTPATQTVPEGTIINLNVTGSDVRNGGTDALLYYFETDPLLGANNIDDSDFTSAHNPIPDSANPKYLEINSSTGVIQIATVIDEITETTEELHVVLTDADNRFLDSATISITDVLSSYNVALDSVRTAPDIIFEGDDATFTVTGNNIAFGGNIDLNWYVDLATDSNFGQGGRGKINSADLLAGYPTEASPAIVEIRNNTGAFTVPTVINTSLVNLVDLTLPSDPANVSIDDPINLYNRTEIGKTIPASTVLSIPFKTLNHTDTATLGSHSFAVDAGRSTAAGYNLVMWISEDAGGTTGTESSSVVSISDETQSGNLVWQHGPSGTGVQGLSADTIYYRNHAWIADTADYSNWVAGDLNPSSFDFISEIINDVSLLDSSIEPDDIGIGALERLVVKLKSITTGQQKGTGVAYLEGVAPEFTVTVAGSNQVVEGEDIVFSIVVLEDQVGDTFTWEIKDPDLSALTDDRIVTTTGTFTAATAGTQVVTVNTIFDPALNGTVFKTLEAESVLRSYVEARIVVTNNNTSQTAEDSIEIFDGPELFTITPTSVPGIQGDSSAFLIFSSNTDDSEAWFYVGLAETTLADFDSDVPQDGSRQRVTFSTANAQGFRVGKVDEVNTPLIGAPTYGDRPRLIFASDGDVGNERVELYVYSDQVGGDKYAELNYTIGPAPVVFAGNNTIDETTNASQSYTVTGLADGTYNYYFIGAEIDQGLTFGGAGGSSAYDINADDFETGYFAQGSAGTLVISSGSGVISFEMKDDKIREGDEVLQIVITDTLGFQAGISQEITVTDTSVPLYTIANYGQLNSTAGGALTTVDEDDALNLNIVADSRMTETLYVQLEDVTAGATSIYPITQKTISAVDGDNWLQFATNGDNSVVDGNRTFKVLVGIDDFPVAEVDAVATLTLTLEDPGAGTIILTADDTTPNESTLVTFTVSGTNIPNGTYYYRLSAQATPETTSGGSGTTIINASGGAAVSVGDEAVSLSGIVQNANSSQILMSQAVSYGFGQTLFFMPSDLYDYFSAKSQTVGTVTITNNTGQFTMQLAESLALVDQPFTIVLGDSSAVTTVLASETITIQNQTAAPAVVGFSSFDLFFDDAEIYDDNLGTPATAFSEIKVKSDGNVYRTGTGAGEGSSQMEYVQGQWVTTGTPTANQFEVQYTLLSQNGGGAQGLFIGGSFDTWNDIDASGAACLVNASVTSTSAEAFNVGIRIHIREKANFQNFEILTLAPQNAGGTGGGLILDITAINEDNGPNPFD